MPNLKTGSPRIASIDLLRGIVMLLMALDHTRDYFHFDVFFFEPTDLDQTTSAIFFTRFITHFCAPVFMFLAGTSAFFVGRRLDKKDLSIWLIKRGLWLVFIEMTVVKFAWYFKFDTSFFEMLVIWALGVAMIFLAAWIHLPKKITIVLCIVGILGHHLLDSVTFSNPSLEYLMIMLHKFDYIYPLGQEIFVCYPLIPWIFVMPLGYYFGLFYTNNYPAEKRQKQLLTIGLIMIAAFFILRFINIYGDISPWIALDSWQKTILSFFNVTKYPPSLFYLLVTLGPAILFLGISEKWKGQFIDKIVVIGKVPMFYYLVHLFVIHGLAVIAVMVTGYSYEVMFLDRWVTEAAELQGYGFGLSGVYLTWLVVVAVLYPLCLKYNNYKANNRDKWWLSYL